MFRALSIAPGREGNMTIKAIKETYKKYKCSGGEHNIFTTYDYRDGNGKVVLVVNVCSGFGKTLMQVVRVSDGEELLKNGRCRPCDNLDDAVDVFGEMMQDGTCE